MNHKIGIIGHGFVGLACETGFQSIADIRVYDKYKNRESLDAVVDHSDILFLCLPTPMNEDRSCDTSIIEEVVAEINRLIDETTVVIKSTVPPGTTERLAKQYPDLDFVFNPEFLTQRNFINDFLEQDRIILGTVNSLIPYDVLDLYDNFVATQGEGAPIIVTEARTAEMLKYFTNSFLATKVSFCNEMYDICEAADIDYENVIKLVQLDKRIGKTHLQVPGFDGMRGWGGACFPKDVNAIIALAEELGVDPLVLESAWTKNIWVREELEWEELAQVTGDYEDSGNR